MSVNFKQVNNIDELMAELESLIGEAQPTADVPTYARLSEALDNLGFNPSVYFDGLYVARTTNPIELIDQRAPITIMWHRDDGQQVIQCAKADGTTMLFWPTAAEDIQSQLASLADRFAKPSILEDAQQNPTTGSGVSVGQVGQD